MIRARVFQFRVVAGLLLSLGACAPTEIPPRPHLRELADLPGWSEDPRNLQDAVGGLSIVCNTRDNWLPEKGGGITGTPGDWQSPCYFLRSELFNVSDDEALREKLSNFVALDPGAGTSALVTGYYEPELEGSRKKDAAHPYPLYRLPSKPTQFDRAEIDSGALAGKKLELLWVSDRIDAFFLQVQGSGRVRLRDGKIVRVGFAGTNERQYVSIGKAMVDAGIMTKEEASLQTIRAYLQAHPDEIDSWLHKNPRFVFFRELKNPETGEGYGPIGALGAPLTPGRSVAVDPEFVPLGLPLWLDTTRPVTNAPLQRLVVAQDKGSAIKGPGRIDLFWGVGAEAEAMAGPMRQQGTYWIIVPRAVGERWLAATSGVVN